MGAFEPKDLSELMDTFPEGVTDEAADTLTEWDDLEDEEEERQEDHKKKLRDMSDQELRTTYVPDVYQESIYRISYTKLKASGIKLISFDIDDTFGDVAWHNAMNMIHSPRILAPDARKKARALVKRLHNLGFTVVLLTNAQRGIARGVWKEIGADGYFYRAGKPGTRTFNAVMEKYGINKSQMAHVGNNIRQDVAGGNAAGVTTCLVRNRGVTMKIGKILQRPVGVRTKGHWVREELKKRGIWRKHHLKYEGDQYYQLGETQKFSPRFKG